MALEHRWRDEGLLTQVTLVLLVSVVYDLDVHVECVLALKGGVTLVTLKRSLTWTDKKRHMIAVTAPQRFKHPILTSHNRTP